MSDRTALQRHTLLMRLLCLAREQGAALQDDAFDRFVALMPEREAIIADLTAAAPPVAPANVVPLRQGVDEDTELAIEALVASVLRQDEENEAVLREQLDAVREALSGISRWYAAAQGYTTALAIQHQGDLLNMAS